jgi:hypothetical protein
LLIIGKKGFMVNRIPGRKAIQVGKNEELSNRVRTAHLAAGCRIYGATGAPYINLMLSVYLPIQLIITMIDQPGK